MFILCLIFNQSKTEDRLNESGSQLSAYDKTVIDELLSLSASFLINIGFWISRQPRKISVALSSDHISWHNLVNEMIRMSPNSKVHFIKHLSRHNLAQLLFYCPEPDTRTMLHMTLSLCLVGKQRGNYFFS